MLLARSTALDRIGDTLAAWIGSRFAVPPDDYAFSLLVHEHSSASLAGAGYAYRGSVPFYPCSVVKMFFMAALQAAYEAGQLKPTTELERATHDVIKWSSNTATNYIIDALTGTTGDTELTPEDMVKWMFAREGVNRFFQALGWEELAGINLSQKLMDDDRYGREKQFVLHGGNNHNRLSTDSAASLLGRIMTGTMISPQRSAVMAEFLHRSGDPEFTQLPGAQVLNYLGAGTPEGSRIWSKAGWTQWTRDPLASYRRHDALHAELPDGMVITLVVFTQGKTHALDLGMLPQISEEACRLLAAG
jgi:beta-lactamase class A